MKGESCQQIREKVVAWIGENTKPKVVLDVGCGAGLYGHDIKTRTPETVMIGVEIWQKYLEALENRHCLQMYNALIMADLRILLRNQIIVDADLVLLMDVIEHFERHEAYAMLSTWTPCIVSTPLFDFKQGELNGNPHEVHKCWFQKPELEQLGYEMIAETQIGDCEGNVGPVGAFVKRAKTG